MNNRILANNNNNEVGMCSICGTVHVDPEGFYYNRRCRECGENRVFSITEYMDMMNDYFILKDELKELNKLIEDNEYDY